MRFLSLIFLLLISAFLLSTRVVDSSSRTIQENHARLDTQSLAIQLLPGSQQSQGSFLDSMLPGTTQTQTALWRDAGPEETATIREHEQGGPRNFRALTLDVELLEAKLRQAPKESSVAVQRNKVTLSLPVPDGSFMNFDFQESSIMEESLAQRYPEIKTYRGQGIEDPTATARFDWTPQGFHAIILSTRGTILIEPDTQGHGPNYIAYFQSQMPKGSGECDTKNSSEDLPNVDVSMRPHAVSGSALRSYRLAVAATAEYTATYGGGTIPGTLSAITTTINLVDAIYEREVAIRLVLIANEDSIIFTDTTTDGYTSNNVVALFNENQAKLDAAIGDANYDIGHIFDGRTLGGGSFSWQGQASIASVCRTGLKGRGVSISRSINPANLYAYYSTAHEMGHQFGASHTFNATTGDCGPQRSSVTAYEPGTGSTIMGYRLNCGGEDLNSQDTYFHHASLQQITAYTTVGSGSCPTPVLTGNGVPTVDAGANYTIPMGTPFTLTATATDPDGDALTYCWEQYDLGNPSPPSTDDGTRPILRSYAPVTSPSRTFPQGANLGANAVPFESLPTTTRTMNFRVSVRDNRAGGGGVNAAGMALNVRADTGPFTVIAPSGFATGAVATVNWNVANTNQPPVSCAAVRILLSTDGGVSFPIVLANNTPNDGSENVTVPGMQTATARLKVEAVGNVFFNVSPVFLITGTTNLQPTITTFSPPNGAAGTSVTITGTNFISPSAVRFNGIDAIFTLNSTTEIVATSPAGDTAGPITVVTAAGTATSPVPFDGAPSYSVSGHIADAANNPLAGATVSFDMNSQGTISKTTAVTDASGNYASGNVGCQNNVKVTPFKPGSSFSPISLTFVSSRCLTGTATANFTANQAGPNTVRFSQATFDANESATNLSVTVSRTGDTSGGAVVDFKTTDTDNFTVGCSDTANNMGGAFARCDYAFTTETIVFNPGETTKTLQIPVINDSFAEGLESFGAVLSNAAGTTLGTPSSAVLRIFDNETIDGPNPIFTTPFFVRQHYLDFLSREPEVGEPWSAVLNNCSDVNNNPNCDRLTVSGAFFGSPEFQLKGYFVYRFYKLAFNRLPSYTEIVTDMRAVTGQTPAEVFQKKGNFTNAFVQRTEFTNMYDGQSNANYVSTLMGRYSLTQITTPDPANPDGTNKVTLSNTDLTNRLNGVGGTLTRVQVLRAIADSDQVFTLEFNPAFVAMQYFGYLRRAPEQSGFAAWLLYLNTHPGDSRTMVNGFMNSLEYRLRFGPNP